jgi:cytochrome c oxidase subunit 3
MAMHAAAVPTHPQAEHGMTRELAGMAFFIASEVMLFGGLFAAYFYLRNQATTWPPEGIEHEIEVPIAAVLSLILISSSVAAHFGILGILKGDRRRFQLGITFAILLGTVFIAGQIFEWFTLMDEGLNAGSGAYGATFYTITGFHGAHVIAGLLMLGMVFLRALWKDFTPSRHRYAEAAVLYWHFVDVIWVFVFFVLYVTPHL